MTHNTALVLGAGIVGVSCALALRQRGWAVTLLDRQPPGMETSHGNAGVLARSSIMPLNNPALWPTLPRLLKNQSASFRYSPGFVLRHPGWIAGFLAHARRGPFEATATALDALIRDSRQQHRRWLEQAHIAHRLRENGWLLLYRSRAAFDASALARATYARFGIRTQTLNAAALREVEPGLRPLFARALWIQDSASVDDPGQIVRAYAKLFTDHGGRFVPTPVARLRRAASGEGWRAELADGQSLTAQAAVVALGPWAKDFLRASLRLSIPMAFERGYHMHYGAEDGAALRHPIYDADGGYVLSPMARGLRLSTGVELTWQNAPPSTEQWKLAERAARAAFPLSRALDDAPWLGSRPTLPDSRPMIGAAPGHPGLWLAIGHQHIGFSTGPGSAQMLAALMHGERGAVDSAPFSPARFLR